MHNNLQNIIYLHAIRTIAQNVLFYKKSDRKIKTLYYI